MRRAMVVVCWLVALVACGRGASTPTPPPTATAVPTSTPTRVPTATPTVAPTATSTPVPTSTATPTATATSTPRVTATATSAPDYTIRDTSGLCQATLPGAFRDDGGIWLVGDEACATLAGLATGGLLDFDTVTQLLVGNIGSQIGDYRETGRTREAGDRLRITYTGRVLGVPGSGIVYQRQFGQTMCGLVLFAAEGKQAQYAPTFERIIASLAAAR